MLPSLLIGMALAASLFVQSMSTPLAGLWLPLFLAGCLISLREGYPKETLVWKAALVWLTAVTASTFVFNPVINAASVMWILSALPFLAMTLHPKYIKRCTVVFCVILTLYALGLIYQQYADIRYTYYNFNGGDGRSWPLLNPNNAAAVMNMAVIPSFYMALRYYRYVPLFIIFATALLITRSQAGILIGAGCCFLVASHRFGPKFMLSGLIGGMAFVTAVFFYRPESIISPANSFKSRIPIWETSVSMVRNNPLVGSGIGTFGYYYKDIRQEDYSSGWFAHNDPLQIGVEMGIPAMILFLAFMVIGMLKAHMAARYAILAVFLHSLVEFQIYLPATSLLLGLAISTNKRKIPG